jgi:hypothetical protein
LLGTITWFENDLYNTANIFTYFVLPHGYGAGEDAHVQIAAFFLQQCAAAPDHFKNFLATYKASEETFK